MLMRMIGSTVRGLPEIFPRLAELGARHATYGVKAEYYPIARDALLMALRDHLGEGFIPEVENAWRETFVAIRDTMLRGAAAFAGSEP